MQCAVLLLLWSIVLVVIVVMTEAHGTVENTTKKTKCLNPPRTARRVELYIKECQEEVKTKLVAEAYQILKDEMKRSHATSIETEIHLQEEMEPGVEYEHEHEEEVEPGSQSDRIEYVSSFEESPRRRMARLMHRIRRVGDLSSGIYHPTLVPYEDKRIAGCLLHCVYARNNAIDALGWPTLDGLVNFYSEGVNEHGFFMATLRSVNLCLRAVTVKYNVNRRKQPEQGESCDLAFDVFDCISDQITGYCLDQFKH